MILVKVLMKIRSWLEPSLGKDLPNVPDRMQAAERSHSGWDVIGCGPGKHAKRSHSGHGMPDADCYVEGAGRLMV